MGYGFYSRLFDGVSVLGSLAIGALIAVKSYGLIGVQETSYESSFVKCFFAMCVLYTVYAVTLLIKAFAAPEDKKDLKGFVKFVVNINNLTAAYVCAIWIWTMVVVFNPRESKKINGDIRSVCIAYLWASLWNAISVVSVVVAVYLINIVLRIITKANRVVANNDVEAAVPVTVDQK